MASGRPVDGPLVTVLTEAYHRKATADGPENGAVKDGGCLVSRDLVAYEVRPVTDARNEDGVGSEMTGVHPY